MDLQNMELGSIASSLSAKALGFLGTDERWAEFRERLVQRIRLSTEVASWVQCIGMPKPIPITKIYQPSRFIQTDGSPCDLDSLLRSRQNAIVFAGPGMGKSTLLNRLYIDLAKNSYDMPLLFPLRSPKSLEDLSYVIKNLGRIQQWELELRKEVERLGNLVLNFQEDLEKKSGPHKAALEKRLAEADSQKKTLEALLGKTGSARIVLLVDGYDEISEGDRLAVSDLLTMYSTLSCGPYLLTCRSFYDVYALKANHFFLAPFSHEDAESFTTTFMHNFGIEVDARNFLNDLSIRGFKDFIAHPLMLTLICVLKTGRSSAILPKSSISLIRRALEILTFRWDEERGVHRDSEFPLDGEDRLRCIMRVAYFMELDQAADSEVEKIIEGQLRLMQIEGVHPTRLLREITQWFGLIYQNSEFNWRFSHKVIHDYLAARFWVESAAFNPTQVRTWTTRAGYAACIVPDATQSLVYALRFSKDITAFVEALANNPLFEPRQVALVVLEHFSRYREFLYKVTEGGISLNTWQDFFSYASDTFIQSLLAAAVGAEGREAELVIGYTGSELLRRCRSVNEDVAKSLNARYKKYGLVGPTFLVRRVMSIHKFTLREIMDLRPLGAGNRSEDDLAVQA